MTILSQPRTYSLGKVKKEFAVGENSFLLKNMIFAQGGKRLFRKNSTNQADAMKTFDNASNLLR